MAPAAIPGPIPGLNVTSTTLIGAGNAASLFPEITPAPAASSASSGTAPAAGRSTSPAGTSPAGQVADAFTPAAGTPELAAQVLGLIALGLAFLLAMTRLSMRWRTRRRGPET